MHRVLKTYVHRLNASLNLLSRGSSEEYCQTVYDSMRRALNEMLKAIMHISYDFNRLIDEKVEGER